MDIQQIGLYVGVAAGSLSVLLGAIKLTQEIWRMFRNVGHMVDDLAHVKHITDYHLGPNDGTKPLHVRVRDIEERV